MPVASSAGEEARAVVAKSDSTSGIFDSKTVEAAPVTSLVVEDYKYDNGNALQLSWVPSIDDQLVDSKVIGYRVYRTENDHEPQLITELAPGANSFLNGDLSAESTYSYYVSTLTENYETESNRTMALSPQKEWINFNRKFLFIIALVISAAIIIYVETAKRGKKLFVRKIAGLEAIDEAVGRATEMGRPVLFIPGIHDMDDVQTLAALTILGRVSRTIADYDTKIFMPVSRSLVMTAARETIKSSYQAASRPDAYSDDMVNYVTDEQFGYVAAVDGI
ncbi:MAG: fibronectin type III domain-containing protein, partial [candidate division Zixibacteria bacterium]|nr:fibronectin type III domain-containing protein [candidate division Zixibacteria bacterium]